MKHQDIDCTNGHSLSWSHPRRGSWARAGLVTLSVALGACTSKSPVELGSSHVKSTLVSASAGGTVAVTAGDDGNIAGAKIQIPAGALAADTTITVDYDPEAIVDSKADAIGPTVELGPDGTRFSTPAVVTLPYSGTVAPAKLVVYAKDASGTTIIPAHLLTLDATAKTVSFEVSHFTRYQCGSTHEPAACDPASDCGPALGLPNWQCEDGSTGGPTGNCVRNADGTCGWEVNWCPTACDPQTACGPAPSSDPLVCADGSIAAVECKRQADGSCGWDISCAPVTCPPDSTDPTGTHCSTPCTANADCPMGTICTNGVCTTSGQACGQNTCGEGEYCCNESCGVCAPVGGACTQEICSTCGSSTNGQTCPPGTTCDPMTGGCTPVTPVTCGQNTCAEGEYCCNESCGICAPFGGACPQLGCEPCGADASCPPGSQCESGQCTSVCPDSACGPQPGIANWTCEDGSTGGPTGRCIPTNGGMDPTQVSCGWEIIWCPRACDPSECGPRPGIANYTCPDGSIAGPTGQCLRNADGTCGWEIIRCP